MTSLLAVKSSFALSSDIAFSAKSLLISPRRLSTSLSSFLQYIDEGSESAWSCEHEEAQAQAAT